jgi:hypothetical protein
MRRRGEKPDNGDDADVQLVSDVRRGRPELDEPGIAEAEKLAGANIFARGGRTDLATRAAEMRGGGGVSPETIERNKAQLKMMVADQLLGPMDLRKVNRWASDRGFQSIVDLDPTPGFTFSREAFGMAAPTLTQKAADIVERLTGDKAKADRVRERAQSLQDRMDAAPQGYTYFQKLWYALGQGKKGEGLPMIDSRGDLHEIPIPAQEE